MNDQELLKSLLKSEEWQSFECKRAAVQPRKLLETAVAFANTDGGFIVLGLEDPKKASGDDRLIGLRENEDNASEFLKLLGKDINPTLHDWSKYELGITNTDGDPDRLLLVSIRKSNQVHSLVRGDTYVRKGSQNIRIGAQDILMLQYEKGTVKYEQEASTIGNLGTLDDELFQRYKKDTSGTEDDWSFLRNNGLATQKNNSKHKLTNAGVLLFSQNPSVDLAGKCSIKISQYYGNKPDYSGKPNFVRRPFSIEGPLLHQVNQALEFFDGVVESSPPKLENGGFQSPLMIPKWAFQEAVTNAVVHRNYFLQDDLQIRFFDNRIEVESPGSFPGHITAWNIKTERFARNPIIQRTLNRFSAAPNLDIGEGVNRMFQVMRKASLYEPVYFPSEKKPHSVLLILFNLKRVEYWDTVSNYLEENYRITNSEARKITDIKDTLRMSRLLKSWVEKGLLEKKGRSKKDTYYIKTGQEVPTDLFSRGYENKS